MGKDSRRIKEIREREGAGHTETCGGCICGEPAATQWREKAERLAAERDG